MQFLIDKIKFQEKSLILRKTYTRTFAMYYINNILLIIACFLCMTPNMHAQDISPPELLNASIINEEGDVKLTWELTDTIDVDIQILRDSLGITAFSDIHIIPDTITTSWTDQNSGANNRPRSYMLKYNFNGSPSSNKFNTIHANLQFDTCTKKINLNWTRYVNSNQYFNFNDTLEIKYYNIWKKTDSGGFQHIDSTPDTSYIDEQVDYNHTYSYFIESVLARDTSIKSRSNRISLYTRMPFNPDFINPDEIRANQQSIDLTFSIAENSELKRYQLLRSESKNGPFDTIETFNTTTFQVEYTDEGVQPANTAYYYYLAGINECNQLTTRSDTVNNIRLDLAIQNRSSFLSWTPYANHPEGISEYKIYRKNGTNPYLFLSSDQTLSYTDSELQLFSGRDSSGLFCYFIEAQAELTTNLSSRSLSNKLCQYVEPDVFLANAFTPNGDGKNDMFRPIFTFIPQKYQLIIYNRRGEKVFETSDPRQPWKGRYRAGRKVPAGTYIYYLEYRNPDLQTQKRRGEINVLYP